jgi:hypothetical protein
MRDEWRTATGLPEEMEMMLGLSAAMEKAMTVMVVKSTGNLMTC